MVRLYKNELKHLKNDPANEAGLLVISRGTALVLLFVYCAYIFFQVSLFFNYRRWSLIMLTHVAENPCWTLYPRGRGGARARGGEDECWCGWPIVSHWICVTTMPSLTTDPFSLLGVTVVTSFCADYCKCPFFVLKRAIISCLLLLSVVASIEEFAERYSVPKPFIGLILLPIVVSKY